MNRNFQLRRTKYDSVVNVTAVSPGDRMVGEAGAGAGATPPATVGEALTPDSRAESCGRIVFFTMVKYNFYIRKLLAPTTAFLQEYNTITALSVYN